MKEAYKHNDKLNIVSSIMPSPIYKVLRCVVKEGPRVCAHKVVRHLRTNRDYEIWMKLHEADIYDVASLDYNPKISVVVPVYNVERRMLEECIDSVRNQTYGNYELILVDDCSTMPEVRKTLEEYRMKDETILIYYRKENGHISGATNIGFL